MIGHNERPLRLDRAARDARTALAHVAKGESMALDGWLAYGQCLNEARVLFPSDDQFGRWVAGLVTDNLSVTPNDHERAAAMWAAANPEQFDEARAAGKARTVRGIHAKRQEIEAAREAEQAGPETDAPIIDQAPDDPAQEPGDDAQDLQPPEADDPHADDRAKLAKLTRAGLEDEVIGLRAENGELRGKVTKLTAERDRWKDQAKELLDAKSDADVIRRMSQTIERMKSQIFRESEAARIAVRQRRKAEDARDDALRKLGEQVIPLEY